MDTKFRRGVPRSRRPYRIANGKCPARTPRLRAVERNGRPDRSRRSSVPAMFRPTLAFPVARTRRLPACRAPGRECASKPFSCLKPFLQAKIRDLALLFCSFAQFSGIVILQSPPQNVENLHRTLTCGAHDKDAAKTLFILAIRLRQGVL